MAFSSLVYNGIIFFIYISFSNKNKHTYDPIKIY